MKTSLKLNYSFNLLKNSIASSFPIVNVRHLSSNASHGDSKVFNPFKRRNTFRNQEDRTSASRICVSILGNGAIGQPRCVGLFTDFRGFLFNCGEGVGRLCREYEITIPHIRNVFITHKAWRNISGLNDIYITNAVYNVPKMYIYGPPDVELFTTMLSSPQYGISVNKRTSYNDEHMEITSIPVNSSISKGSLKVDASSGHADITYSYVCKIFGKLGDFNPEKCVDLGVPFGPHLLKLKNGEDVVLPSGRMIFSSDVLDSVQPTINLLIVDCPSQEFLDPFVNEMRFSEFQLPTDNGSEVTYVFHFSPLHIFNSDKYRAWMQKFHLNTEHYALNSSNPSMSSDAVSQTQNILHLLHPEIFKQLPEQIMPLEGKVQAPPLTASTKIINPPPMLQLQLRPETKLIWNNVVTSRSKNCIEMLQDLPDFSQKLNKLKYFLSSEPQIKGSGEYPEVIFLGTSSATSTAFRNVSSILLNINSHRSIILDCGEGTFQQLVRYYGRAEVESLLQNISCVFVSHKHTDHYMGLFELIKARAEAFENSCNIYRPMAVMLPYVIQDLFHHFCHLFEPLKPKVTIFTCKNFVSTNQNHGSLKQFLGDIELQTVPVRHCHDAYGAVINHGSKWKIVYSGDSAPCQRLIDAGKDCQLLIHEASVEDNLVSEATDKMHSTPAQVIDTAEKMNAQFTIMTHFSKRYLAVPVSILEECDNENIGCAFDFMKVRFQDLPALPLFLPALKCLFQEEMDTHLEKSSSVVHFENVFLKTYKSAQTS